MPPSLRLAAIQKKKLKKNRVPGIEKTEEREIMRIQIIRQTIVNGKDARIGDIVSAEQATAEWLIRKTFAVEATEKPKAKKTKAKK